MSEPAQETEPHEQPTQTGELGAPPDPEIEPREPNPGGVDAMPQEEDNLSADLSPADNPALQSESPDPLKEAVSEGEDTDTEATKNGDEVPPEKESPA
jgi:hypothetical protein